MPNGFSNVCSLMMWPWTQTQNNRDWLTMMQEAQNVIIARLPTLWHAFFFPFQADHEEIHLIWSEKSKAFDQSSKVIERTRRRVEIASKVQQNAVARLQSGGMVTFFEMFEMYQRNINAMASLASLPTAVLKPVKTKVSANARRLGRE